MILHTPEGKHAVECPAGEFIWNAAARAGIWLPATCHQGHCLTCAARLIAGEVDQSASRSYYPADRTEGWVLLCTARPLGPVEVKTHQQEEMRAHRLAQDLPAPL